MSESCSVFLSYKRPDADKVREIHEWLTARSYDAWMDEKNLQGGELWEAATTAAIAKADLFLALLSRNSDASGHFQAEVQLALQRPVGFVIPVRFEDCPFPPGLEARHTIDLFHPDGREKLTKSLRSRFPLKPLRILIVEDDSLWLEALRKRAREALEQMHCPAEITGVVSYSTGKEQLEGKHWDLLITDIAFPSLPKDEKWGIQLAATARMLSIPCIVVSGAALDAKDGFAMNKELGVAAFIPKIDFFVRPDFIREIKELFR